jgi:outer membrane lipoprotein-sorting protein
VNRQGKAYFSKPAKFRWNFESDKFGNEEFYFDGKTLTHYKEKDQLVTHYKANVGLARELREVVNFVLDPTNLFDRYQIKDLTRKDQLTTIDLIPRAETSTDVQQVQVTVVDRSRYVRRVKIIYADGNYTQFTFRNPVEKTNQPELFRFTRQGNFTVRSHG